ALLRSPRLSIVRLKPAMSSGLKQQLNAKRRASGNNFQLDDRQSATAEKLFDFVKKGTGKNEKFASLVLRSIISSGHCSSTTPLSGASAADATCSPPNINLEFFCSKRREKPVSPNTIFTAYSAPLLAKRRTIFSLACAWIVLVRCLHPVEPSPRSV